MVRMFLVTANVGSVFENLEKGLDIWMNEFTSVIRSRDPEFVAIHFQETGGKNYENGSDCIDIFFGRLVEKMGQLNFRRGEGFVDSRSDLEHQFTALSNVYFVHESVHPHAVAIWDFQAKCFQDVQSHPPKIYTGGELDHVYKKEKEKFPQNFYPNCKWSRKGFLRTRWRISGKTVDFVNIHLFHDSDNVVAASSFPSEFAESRQRTLNYTLNRLQNNPREIFPLFIFGDFNFRLNTHGVLSHLEGELVGGENSNGVSHGVTISTKKFNLPELERRFLHSFHWLKQFDFEGQHLHEILDELNFEFHPTYPFEEDENEPEKFMRTRCPAWCDRILFTHPTKDIISQESPIEYNVLGSKTCMGDHKPVYLTFTLLTSPPQSPSSQPPPRTWEHSSSSSINKPPFRGQSATLVILPDQQGLCLSPYRMTLTPMEKGTGCPLITGKRSRGGAGCMSKRHHHHHHHPHPPQRRCLANLFGLRNLRFPGKKQSVSSDSVSINPPSSQISSDENESTMSTTTESPAGSRSNTIIKKADEKTESSNFSTPENNGDVNSEKRKFPIFSFFYKNSENNKLESENKKIGPGESEAKNNKTPLGKNNGIEDIVEPFLRDENDKNILQSANNPPLPNHNRIILPLLISEKDNIQTVEIQDLTSSKKSVVRFSFFQKWGKSNTRKSNTRRGENKVSSYHKKNNKDTSSQDTLCCKCVIF